MRKRTQKKTRPASPGAPVAAALVKNHARFLAYVRRRVSTAEAAEEILQMSYVKGLEKASAIREGEKVTAWFYRVLRNTLFDYYRRSGAEGKALAGYLLESELEAGRKNDALQRTACRCVSDVIETLRPAYAALLKRAELGDESVKDLARRHKTTATNISVQLHRARKALRARMLDACGACARHACVDCSCRRSE